MLEILATWEAEIRRIRRTAQAKKKLVTPISREKIWAFWHTPIIPATMVKSIKQDLNLGQLGQKVRPYLKNNQRKKGWKHGSSSRVPA
jgi:hypothetical protein